MSRLLCFKSLKFLDLLKSSRYFSVVILFFLLLVFTNTILAQDTVSPTVSLSSSDIDKLIATSDTVTITASFSEAMTATPTLSISGGLLSSTAFTSYIQGGIQLGADIDGGTVGFSNHQLGKSVSLSSDGSRAAIGSGYGKGHVGIYSWNGSGWTQLGANIDAEAGGDNGGWSVSLSSDGSRVAIGATHNDASGSLNNDNRGHVRIYSWNGSAWTQLGADIDGEASLDQSGWSVSLSSDGSRVAIGAPNNDAGNGVGDNRGHVRIYNYTPSGTASWTQLGADIDGEASSDYSGIALV